MRILVAHDVPPARTGGMSRIMAFSHDRLSRFGYDVEYLHADAPVSGPAMLRRFAFPMAVLRRIREAEQQGQPFDLVNIHEPSAVPTLLARRRGSPLKVVVTTHGVNRRAWELALEERRLGREGPSLKSRVVYPISSLWQSRIGLTRADHVLCLNEEDRRFLIDRFHVRENAVTRIFPGVDFAYADAARRRDYGRSGKLIFAGTWRKNKGIEDLVPAFVSLVRRYPRLQLVVLGAGVPDAEVQRSFPESVRGSVACVTGANDAHSARLFAEADVFLLPSLFEGTPLTLVEAMASGLPIVTTDVCGMKDLIEHGRNGLLVPIRSPEAIVQAVSDLIEDAGRRRQLGISARQHALTEYTWERTANRIGVVYDWLLERTARAQRDELAETSRYGKAS